MLGLVVLALVVASVWALVEARPYDPVRDTPDRITPWAIVIPFIGCVAVLLTGNARLAPEAVRWFLVGLHSGQPLAWAIVTGLLLVSVYVCLPPMRRR
jgi:hypothetical protein